MAHDRGRTDQAPIASHKRKPKPPTLGRFLRTQPRTQPRQKPLFCGHFRGATDHRHCRLLRARRERPCGRRAAEKCDEFTPPHNLAFRPSMISYFVVGIPRSASQENWPPMAATATALRIRAKAAMPGGEAEQRRRHRRMPCGWTRRISLSLNPGYEFNLPFERPGVGSDGGPRRRSRSRCG